MTIQVWKIEHAFTKFTAYVQTLADVSRDYGWTEQALWNKKQRSGDNFIYKDHIFTRVDVKLRRNG